MFLTKFPCTGLYFSGISSLSNIFGVTVAAGSQTKDTPSLRYVAPKQSTPIKTAGKPGPATKDTPAADNAQDWKVQIAKVVTAYKLLNRENISQGKIGLAILQNAQDERLRLILYRTKTNVLSTCTLKDDVVIYRSNFYLQFHDDLQLFWSVLLEPQDLDQVLGVIGSKVKSRDLEVEEVKREATTISSTSSTAPATDPPDTVMLHSEPRSDSSDEKLHERRTNILTRMAKMGQPLPKLHPSPTIAALTGTDVSDSSDTETKVKSVPKPTISTRKPKTQALVPAANMQMANVFPGYVATTPHTISTQLAATASDSQYLNILLAENRTHNSEVRMNISKLETKIEKVLDRIDILNSKTPGETHASKEDDILALEEKVLELKKDNRALRLRIQDLEKADHALAASSSNHEDFSEFQSDLERYSIPADGNSKPSEVYRELIRRLSAEAALHSESLAETRKYFESSKVDLENLSVKLQDTENMLAKIKANYEEEIQSLNVKLEASRKENAELENCLKDQSSGTEQLVKQIMNNLYQKLTEEFEQAEAFTTAEVVRICAHAIKTETNNVIKRK